MLDSIHLARWISQFSDSNLEILLFPSSHFRKVHSKLVQIQSEKIKVFGFSLFGTLLGYLDSLVTFRFLNQNLSFRVRRTLLKLVIRVFRPETIHAIEIQHAGYLVSDIMSLATRRILTNWGSDIYYFQHFPEHKLKIERALQWATHYSAECERDYGLARALGFSGFELPKIPNAGGFEFMIEPICGKSDSKLILVKCYGGAFGLGNVAIELLDRFLQVESSSEVFLYSVTQDLVEAVLNLQTRFPTRVSFSTVSNPLSYENLRTLFQESIIYLGLSRSDGLSTSFLEAMCHGSYPIQSDTSCAEEVLSLGGIGSIVKPESDSIMHELSRVFNDVDLRLLAAKQNKQVATKYLEFHSIASTAATFYSY
jgi:hypothetical protein